MLPERRGKRAVITAALGEDKVISGTVTTAIGRRGTGEIVIERLRGVGLANEHILAASLVAVLEGAGLRARQFTNAAAMKWSKMFTNLVANASSAILDMPPDAIFAHPGLYAMEVRMLREALRVMRAQNIPVVDLPGTPVRALAWLVSALAAGSSAVPCCVLPLSAKGSGDKMPSFHIDLHSGRGKSEVDYLNGAVARYGIRCGMPAPVNRILTDTLSALTCGDIPLDRFAGKPEMILGTVPGLNW